jgi:uncharacterized membrane protein YphA (DoxX/SURF4 family)
MDAVVFAARLVLAAVFAVAGWTKARDPAGTRAAVRDFGVPDRLAPPVAFLLPVAELTVAILLPFERTSAAGAIGAIALLAIFIVAITASLARGQRPDCHCFGQVRSEPVTSRTVARNCVLIALAIFVAVA